MIKQKFIFIFLIILFFTVISYADETTRKNVSDLEANPNRIKTDDFFYFKLGYGGLINDSVSKGAAFGIGYRYEMDELGVDISLLNTIIDRDGYKGYYVSLARLGGIYFFNPISNNTFYLSGGIEYSLSEVEDKQHNEYDGNGLGGTASLGFETMRTSTVRMFFQFDASLPFYNIDYNGDEKYFPVFALYMGIGI